MSRGMEGSAADPSGHSGALPGLPGLLPSPIQPEKNERIAAAKGIACLTAAIPLIKFLLNPDTLRSGIAAAARLAAARARLRSSFL